MVRRGRLSTTERTTRVARVWLRAYRYTRAKVPRQKGLRMRSAGRSIQCTISRPAASRQSADNSCFLFCRPRELNVGLETRLSIKRGFTTPNHVHGG